MFMLQYSLWSMVCQRYSILLNIKYEDIYQELICITCVEKVLERNLDLHDFLSMPINLDDKHHSINLKDRLKGFREHYTIPSIRNSYNTMINNGYSEQQAKDFIKEMYNIDL